MKKLGNADRDLPLKGQTVRRRKDCPPRWLGLTETQGLPRKSKQVEKEGVTESLCLGTRDRGGVPRGRLGVTRLRTPSGEPEKGPPQGTHALFAAMGRSVCVCVSTHKCGV